MRTPIEVWDTVQGVDEYGVPTTGKKLLVRCTGALKEVSNTLVGDTTRSVNSTLQVTIRFNRSIKSLTSSMYVVIDGEAYDITTPPNNNWRLNKYVSFNATKRNK